MTDFITSMGFIAYRLPNQTMHHLCCIDEVHRRNPESNLANYQFIFAPFDKNSHPTYLFNFSVVEIDGELPSVELSSGDLINISEQEYILTCQSLIDQITQEDISKVILSRPHSVPDTNIDLNKLFLSMCNAYPDAFVYVIHNPEVGTWAAATPELLLSQNDNIIKTVALAGTRKYTDHNTEPWGNKEIEEHKYIETYVHESLMSLDLDYMKSNVRTKRAGNVEHIISIYEIEDTENRFEELIETLHPGPAISGYPPSEAIKIIDDIETYDRQYYCGYLGLINVRYSSSDLYVNLRCMQIYSNGCKIYVGGGITKDSIAYKEWIETKLKSETLTDIILSTKHENH
jgi:isochorismate synthase